MSLTVIIHARKQYLGHLLENPRFVGIIYSEIQMMMFGLGDCSTPHIATASLIGKIVLQQMVVIVGMAEEMAEIRGVDAIFPQDILFLMRKDLHKLNRIVNYIGFKDLKKNIMSTINDGDMPRLEDMLPHALDETNIESSRKSNVIQLLQNIGINLEDAGSVDVVKNERLRRSDVHTQNMSQKCFNYFNHSRRTTFSSAKFGNLKFLEWVKFSCPECPIHKLKSYSAELLVYLAKETIAQVVDIALILRQDAKVSPNDPFSRAHQIHHPFETFGSSQRNLDGPSPISVEEVREVLRRFYSMQISPWGAFTSNVDSRVFNRILTC